MGAGVMQTDNCQKTYEELKAKGVTSDYFVKVAEVDSEVAGALYDWQKHLRSMSIEELKTTEQTFLRRSAQRPWRASRDPNTFPMEAKYINIRTKSNLEIGKFEILEDEIRRRQFGQTPLIDRIKRWLGRDPNN